MNIKFLLFYLYKIIISSPWKIAFIIISLVSFRFAGSFADSKEELNIIDSLHLNNEYQYVYTNISDNKLEYKIYTSPQPTKLQSGKIVYYSYNVANVFLWFLFGISTVILICVLIVGIHDEDAGWNFGVAFSYALTWFVRCDRSEDGNTFSYHAFGKLVAEETGGRYRADVSYVARNIRSYRELKMLPKYVNIKEEREKRLKTILN